MARRISALRFAFRMRGLPDPTGAARVTTRLRALWHNSFPYSLSDSGDFGNSRRESCDASVEWGLATHS